MKVSAANQSLILANDGPTGGRPPASASQSSRSSSSGGTSATGLHRLTVVAELPDSTVVTLHADYANPVNQSDRVVSSQTPAAAEYDDSDANIDTLLGTGTRANTDTRANTGASGDTGATASSLVELSSPAYHNLLRDSDSSRDTAGNPHSSNGSVALYARTQRTTGASSASALVDVHA